MSRYVTVRLTVEQAHAAENALDMYRNECDACGDRKREAALYRRACEVFTRALRDEDECRACRGTGKVHDDDTDESRKCLDCGGEGRG